MIMWVYELTTGEKRDIPNAWIQSEEAETVSWFENGDTTKLSYGKKVYKDSEAAFYKGAAGGAYNIGKYFLIAAGLGLAAWLLTGDRKNVL